MFRQVLRANSCTRRVYTPVSRCARSYSTRNVAFNSPKVRNVGLGFGIFLMLPSLYSYINNDTEVSEPVAKTSEPVVSKSDGPVSSNTSESASSSASESASSNTSESSESAEPETGAEDREPTAEDYEGAAYNPVTGEINWDCPCLGGMAHGPCGEEFKEAFACFVYSETEPKGMDCIKKFEGMRTCFRRYPEVYKEQLMDEEELEAAHNEKISSEAPVESTKETGS